MVPREMMEAAYRQVVDTVPGVLSDAEDKFAGDSRMQKAVQNTKEAYEAVLCFSLNPASESPVLSPFADMRALGTAIAKLSECCIRMEKINAKRHGVRFSDPRKAIA